MNTRTPSEAQPPRMEALARLPVFYALAGRRAVVAGGSAAAAWKAELLAAAGARVELYAPLDELCDLFQDLIGHADPQIAHHDRHWTADILNGAAIANMHAASSGEAQSVYG